jgi:hypothetical protein
LTGAFGERTLHPFEKEKVQEIKRQRAKIKKQKEKQKSFESIFDFCPLLFAF